VACNQSQWRSCLIHGAQPTVGTRGAVLDCGVITAAHHLGATINPATEPAPWGLGIAVRLLRLSAL
jgi:hypothetical protein